MSKHFTKSYRMPRKKRALIASFVALPIILAIGLSFVVIDTNGQTDVNNKTAITKDIEDQIYDDIESFYKRYKSKDTKTSVRKFEIETFADNIKEYLNTGHKNHKDKILKIIEDIKKDLPGNIKIRQLKVDINKYSKFLKYFESTDYEYRFVFQIDDLVVIKSNWQSDIDFNKDIGSATLRWQGSESEGTLYPDYKTKLPLIQIMFKNINEQVYEDDKIQVAVTDSELLKELYEGYEITQLGLKIHFTVKGYFDEE